MASTKKLARYIYENQKRGFSDIEIYQLLEQSGWEKNDIDGAFLRAHLLKNIDIILSSPFLYLKNGFREMFKLLKFISISGPQNINLYFQRKKKQKIHNQNTIKEVSKYIEKNLQKGALENDIFIELLKTGWNETIINKSFSLAHSKIFKEKSALFLKSLALLPHTIFKKIFILIFSISKNILFELPITIFSTAKKALIFAFMGSRQLLSSIAALVKKLLINIFYKKPASKIISKVSPVEKLSIAQKIKPIIFNTIDSLKKTSAKFILLFKKKTPSIEKGIALKIIRRSPTAHFFSNIKYFIKSYDTALPRLKQKLAYSLSRSIMRSRGKLLRIFFSFKDFIGHDLRFLTKKVFIVWSPLLIKNIYNFLTSAYISNLIKSTPGFILKAALSPFILIYKIILFPIGSIKKINIEIFNIPFELAEFFILKIYKNFKKVILSATLSLANKLNFSVKSLRKIIMPTSKEAAFLPQNLSEVPIGEVSDAMRAIDVLAIASRMFKTRRMRTFLTILGIGIGIGAILFLVSLGYGLQRILIEEIATSDALLSLDIATRDERLIPLDKESVKSLTDLQEVSYVSPLISVAGQISLGNITANTIVNGVLPNYFKLAGISADAGELFKEGEEDKILISLPMVKLLGFTYIEQELSEEQLNEIIGKSISVVLLNPTQPETGLEEVQTVEFKTEFKISGIIEDSAESLIYFPLSRLENVGVTKYQSAKVRVKSNDSIEAVRTKSVEMGFIVAALSDTVEQANRVFQVLQIVLALFGIVALAVSAIGMFNTMTIALLERTQEIGIMKSLGASNRNVWELFLAESIIMGFLGGVGGILVGYISSEGFNLMIRILAGALGGRKVQLFERPWWFILTILIFSTIVGLFTGLWPARRAARINILAALRYK